MSTLAARAGLALVTRPWTPTGCSGTGAAGDLVAGGAGAGRRAFVDRFGAVVGRDNLVRRAAPAGAPRATLDVHMLRLRRRIGELGLEVRTVRARGYLLQAMEGSIVG